MFSLPFAPSLLTACRPSIFTHSYTSPLANPLFIQSRFRSQLAPRRIHFIKRHKGVLPIPTGGSIKGTTLAFGDWGIRIRENGARLSAKQLTAAEEVIKRKLKIVKGARSYMRVFPDIPVCIKVCFVYLCNKAGYSLYTIREMRRVWEKEKVHSSFGPLGMCIPACFCFSALMLMAQGCTRSCFI